MSFTDFNIKNSQCVREATISVLDKGITILYGCNGLGKSSIGKSIKYKLKGLDLDELRTFGSIITPEVNIVGDVKYHDVLCFDKSFIENSLFNGTDAFNSDDSKRFYLSNPSLEEKRTEINNLLANILNELENDSLKKFISDVDQIVSSNGFFKEDGDELKFNGKSGASKGLKPLTSFETQSIHQLNTLFEEIVKSKKMFAWFDWLSKTFNTANQKNLNGFDICPYCGSKDFKERLKDIERIIEESKQNKAISQHSGAIELLDILKNLVLAKDVDFIDSLKELTVEQDDDFKNTFVNATKHILIEKHKIEYLSGIIDHFNGSDCNFDLKKILIDCKLNESYFSFIDANSRYVGIATVAKNVNNHIDCVLDKFDDLNKAVNDYNTLITNSISASEQEINGFLKISGIPYLYKANKEGEKVTTYIHYEKLDESDKLVDPKGKLSFGEQNSLSLALFGALAKKADEQTLIILDDPISSYDENKKQAVLHFLFNKDTGLLKGKTVLILTHDMEPVIDFIRIHTIRHEEKNAKAYLIYGKTHIDPDSGIERKIISLKEITYRDIVSVIQNELDEARANKAHHNEITRLVHYRRYLNAVERFENGHTDEKTQMLYDYISGMSKLYKVPVHNDKSGPFSDKELNECDEILRKECNFDESFSYKTVVNRFRNNEDLLFAQYLQGANDYFQNLITVRLLNQGQKISIDNVVRNFISETFHIENLSLYDIKDADNVPLYIKKQIDGIYEELKNIRDKESCTKTL